MKKCFIWGTGKIAEYFLINFAKQKEQLDLAGFIDNDRTKQGKLFHGKPIWSPERINQEEKCDVIILCLAYEEIRNQINQFYSDKVDKIETPLIIPKLRLLSRYRYSDEKEFIDVLRFIDKNSLQIFNYEFTKIYDKWNPIITFDEESGLFYTIFMNHRMYFARYLNTEDKVRNYYRGIAEEQDIDSPHRYLTEQFDIGKEKVVIDAGAAEGNFSLSIIDSVKKIYIFEPDHEWVEALNYTFSEYLDRVTIIEKYASDYVDCRTTTIDTIINENVDFMKMDIEGEEYYALKGAKEHLASSSNMKCVICTYHSEFDYFAISDFFKKNNFEITPSKGYMWFPYDKDYIYSMPTLRRGLIRAQKEEQNT